MKIPSSRVDPLYIEIPKKPAGKTASEHRKATKPIMEKRRRARINNCLDQIKSLILRALNKDPAKHTKLEKADILEMTVEYLKEITNPIDKISAMKSFVAGMDECASEVKKFVENSSDVDSSMKRRILSSLTLNGINHDLVSSSSGPSSPSLSPLNMQTTTITFNTSSKNLTPPPSANSVNSSNESFRFSPVQFKQNNHFINHNHLNHHQSNYILAPISPAPILDDPMDYTPVDCSKSSKLNLEENVWRPW